MAKSLISDTATVVGSWAKFIAHGLDSYGIDARELLLEAGIDLSAINDPNERLPVCQMNRVWELVVARTGDPCIALTLASRATPAMYSGFGQSLMFSQTLQDAINRTCEFSRVASEGAIPIFRERGDSKVEFVLHVTTTASDEAVEAFMATYNNLLRTISDDAYAPLEVHFQHDKEPYRQAYEDFFNAPLVFNAAEYKTVLSREAMNSPCHLGNPELAANADEWMRDYLGRFVQSPVSQNVCGQLTKNLPEGSYGEKDVADALRISVRTLQRNLKKEGTSFTELLDVTRRDLALKFIGENQISLLEMCCTLGFSDQSNFTKAFKRWTGQTPHAYRRGTIDGTGEK